MRPSASPRGPEGAGASGSQGDARRLGFDQAATSFPKPAAVWEAFLEQARVVGAPAGRSGYRRAQLSDRTIARAREAAGRFFGATGERVGFTLNATDALNLAVKGLLRSGDHVVTTAVEHNSVLRPLSGLERRIGLELTRVAAGADGRVDPGALLAALRPSTRLVVMQHASNVSGALHDFRAVSLALRERSPGCAFLLDAAQTAGALAIDVERDAIDLLAVPGHKGLLGPPGTGALILGSRVGEDLGLLPFREGGTGSESESPFQPESFPQRLEAGSPNTPGIAGLAAALAWIAERGLAAIRAHELELMARFQAGLDRIRGLVWHGPRRPEDRVPVYALNLRELDPQELSAVLDSEFGIETRAGLHCAPGAHRALGTFPRGACRFSFGPLTTAEEIDLALAALEEIGR